MRKKSESPITYVDQNDPLWKKLTIHGIELLSGKRKIERLYHSVRDQHIPGPAFWQMALDALDISLDYDRHRLAAIPDTGPLVIIANHPFGVVDGLSICYLASLVRPDFRILTNSVLCQDKELNKFMLPVDFADTREAAETNIQTKQKAIELLKQDGTIVIFPGGGVSTAQRWFGPALDLEWKRFTAKLIQLTRATVVPFFFHGQNSRLFQIVSQFSLTLRLALLLKEVQNKMGLTIKVTIGNPIPYGELEHLKNRQELLDTLRIITYDLSRGDSAHLSPGN